MSSILFWDTFTKFPGLPKTEQRDWRKDRRENTLVFREGVIAHRNHEKPDFDYVVYTSKVAFQEPQNWCILSNLIQMLGIHVPWL